MSNTRAFPDAKPKETFANLLKDGFTMNTQIDPESSVDGRILYFKKGEGTCMIKLTPETYVNLICGDGALEEEICISVRKTFGEMERE